MAGVPAAPAVVEEQLAGIATLRREVREKLRHKAHVFGMYVRPEQRRRGVGDRRAAGPVTLQSR